MMATKQRRQTQRSQDRYYRPSLRPWGHDDYLVLADLLFDGFEPAEIARILNRYVHDVLRALRSPEMETAQRWLIIARYAARFPW
ncbi:MULTISPECIES: hypothetical protein [Limnochorda]|uniref:hypothetical protein n=1 Tax=Limnochorda TaxID=1676651 RepID=UPI001D21DB89|nr:hypothetical protein [Limnochorda pilosa]MBO2486574.1 hypothetical protein [Bacillota bacterium]MBO2518466.1 hypothetical protein [Bacillota bacterium]